MSEHADDGVVSWYDGVAAALREKPPADVARELSGLVDVLTDDAEDERREAIHRLAALDRERNRDTYDELADE